MILIAREMEILKKKAVHITLHLFLKKNSVDADQLANLSESI